MNMYSWDREEQSPERDTQIISQRYISNNLKYENNN